MSNEKNVSITHPIVPIHAMVYVRITINWDLIRFSTEFQPINLYLNEITNCLFLFILLLSRLK